METIEFQESDGTVRKLVWDSGDESVGLAPKWVVDDEEWERLAIDLEDRDELENDYVLVRGRAEKAETRVTELEADLLEARQALLREGTRTGDIEAERDLALARIKELEAEVARLTNCLQTANGHHEHFERQWYLCQDRIEELETVDGAEFKPSGDPKWDAQRRDAISACRAALYNYTIDRIGPYSLAIIGLGDLEDLRRKVRELDAREARSREDGDA